MEEKKSENSYVIAFLSPRSERKLVFHPESFGGQMVAFSIQYFHPSY